jgi:site-specific DNA recombinase
LEEAVWKEVSELLKDPHLVAREYDRRLTTKNKRNEDLSAIEREEWKVKNGISRLIDSYTNGLIEKEEFEPRVKNLRQRLSVLEEQSRNVGEEISLQNELRLIITRLEDFAKEIELGLSEAEWLKKREIIRTVVKRIEIGKEEVNVVYRIPPEPFDLSSDQNILQYCTKRHCH